MFQSNQITTAHRPLVEQTDRPETAQFSPRKYSSRQAPILPRRKAFEASAHGYLTTEYRKSPVHASRVPRGPLSHWVRIYKLPNGPAAGRSHKRIGFVFSKPPASPNLASLRKTPPPTNSGFAKNAFSSPFRPNLVLSSPKPSILVSQDPPFLRLLNKPHEIIATGKVAPCTRDSVFSPICCRHNA
jgi:hypothetical protein